MPRTIVLISCGSKKLAHRAKARDLYTSPLFRLNLAYATRLRPYAVYILSAKYGLLDLDREIDPYNVTLNTMTADERKQWARGVVAQIEQRCDLAHDHFVFLAGKHYREHLTPHMRWYHVPMEGLTIGRQLHYLSQEMRG